MFGPSGTPYSLGCFEFDIWLADTYPSGPPLVRSETSSECSLFRKPHIRVLFMLTSPQILRGCH